MPGSGCSALHGVNPNKKKQNTIPFHNEIIIVTLAFSHSPSDLVDSEVYEICGDSVVNVICNTTALYSPKNSLNSFSFCIVESFEVATETLSDKTIMLYILERNL